MNKKILGMAIVVAMGVGSAQAAVITYQDAFGTFGDPMNLPTDVTNQPVTVNLFDPSLGTLTGVTVEIRGSISTKGTYKNNGTDANVNATVLATGDWKAAPGAGAPASLTNHVFVSAFNKIIDQNLGLIASGASGSFGPFTNDRSYCQIWCMAASGVPCDGSSTRSPSLNFTPSTTSANSL